MSAMNEANLPGVGRKIWLETTDGGRISIIAYNNDEYEIYLTPEGEKFPTSAVRLTSAEATILGSAFPAGGNAEKETLMPQTTCVVVSADSPVLGMDATSLDSGDAFVAAVASISNDSIKPCIGHVVQTADVLYLMGSKEDREVLARSIQHA